MPSGILPSRNAIEQVSGIPSAAGTFPWLGYSHVGDPGRASIHPASGKCGLVHPLACGHPSMGG
jgi:hypothetical protein